MPPDLRERAQVLLHRAQALRSLRRGSRNGARARPRPRSRACTGRRRRRRRSAAAPRDDVDALDGQRVALLQRPRDHRLDADEHVPRLLHETEERGVGLLALVDPHRRARLEARVVDRRHELLREERAHRLADRVGRGDARDAEAVGDLGRERRLAGPGRAADEQRRWAGRARGAPGAAGGGAPRPRPRVGPGRTRPRRRGARRRPASSSRPRTSSPSIRRASS